MTREEAKERLREGEDETRLIDKIYDSFEDAEEDYEGRILELERQLNAQPRVPEHPTPEEERKIWPSLQADNLHDAEKWRYLEEIADKCNLNTIRQIFKEHVSGAV